MLPVVQGCKISRSQTEASDEVNGKLVQPPTFTGAGIVGQVKDATKPDSCLLLNHFDAQSCPETPGRTPAAGSNRSTFNRRFLQSCDDTMKPQ